MSLPNDSTVCVMRTFWMHLIYHINEKRDRLLKSSRTITSISLLKIFGYLSFFFQIYDEPSLQIKFSTYTGKVYNWDRAGSWCSLMRLFSLKHFLLRNSHRIFYKAKLMSCFEILLRNLLNSLMF